MSPHPEVDAYLAAAPADQQSKLAWLRCRIRESLPTAAECFESGMPVYKSGDRWLAGFASRKKGVMFYAMDAALLDRYSERLGKNRSGKSCIEMTPNKRLSQNDLDALALEILGELAKR
ncbi:MAG: DUF1801 domain-containing protein [Bryobacteraceae bacterium]|nr:DUF1801 domain-containing protein [Bryobacteraceae bacterium]